jgi:carboxyl-terminal processing protease
MQSSYLKRIGAVVLGVMVIFGSFIAGSRYGAAHSYALGAAVDGLYNKDSVQEQNVDFAPFWKAWQVLNEKFVPTHSEKIPQDQDKVWGAIKGLASSYGDPYTTFFPPVENQNFQTQINGNFEGVGMEVGIRDGVITIIAPLKGSPAERAGIKSGDRILKIGTTTTDALTVDEAVTLMRGPKGTSVKLTLLGKDAKAPREITIIREQIKIPTLDMEKKPNGVFVIHLYSFTGDSSNLFRNALLEFMRSGSSKLVLDLRGNPGGYLDSAIDMSSWFLPSDKVIVKEDSGGHGQSESYYSRGYNVFNKNNNSNFQMVILVDGGSASASEILAGALQEHGIAKLVGTQTFGKGSVQELINLTPKTSLKVTVARWLTPNGTSISAHGLTPDVVVPISEDDVKQNRDPQLDKALQILNGR